MLSELGLTQGELFVVVFVVATVLSARFWPRIGERLADKLSAGDRKQSGQQP